MPYGTPQGANNGQLNVYRNLFGPVYRNGSPGTVARLAEPFTDYKILFYNNTVVSFPFSTWSASGGGSWAAGSSAQNNIYWNCVMGGLQPPSNYNFSSGTAQ